MLRVTAKAEARAPEVPLYQNTAAADITNIAFKNSFTETMQTLSKFTKAVC